MNTNLIDEANRVLTPNFLSQVAHQAGTDPAAVQMALRGALPMVLDSLIRRASEPGGLSSVMDLTAQVTMPDRAAGDVIEPAHGILDQLAEAATGKPGSFAHLLSLGSNAVSSLFSTRAGMVTDALAKDSGLLPTSASLVLSLAATVMLGLLGRNMASDANGPQGMAALLNSQIPVARQAMPAGLSALLVPASPHDSPGIQLAGAETSSSSATPRSPLSGPAPVVADEPYSD